MLPQEILIELFLSNPSKELLSVIDNNKLALRLLKDLPNSLAKCYFLWQKNSMYISVPNLIKTAIREKNSEIFNIFRNKIGNLNRDIYAKLAAKHNAKEILNILIEMGASNWIDIADSAAEGNNLDIVNSMILKDSNCWSSIVHCAAKGNHKDLLTQLVSTDSFVTNAFISHYAAEGGYLDTVLAMVDKGINDYNDIACSAAKYGHLDIVLSMINLGANEYDMIAKNAAEGGHKKIVDAMISGFKNTDGVIVGANNWEWILYGAAKGGRLDIVDDMISRYGQDINYFTIVKNAAEGGHRDILLKYFDRVTNYTMLLVFVLAGRLEDIAHKIIDEKQIVNYSMIVETVIKVDLESVAYRLIDRVEDCRSMVKYACSVGREDVAFKLEAMLKSQKEI